MTARRRSVRAACESRSLIRGGMISGDRPPRRRRSEIFPSFQSLETGWLGLLFLSPYWKLAGWLRGVVSNTPSLTVLREQAIGEKDGSE